ncbi:hypothetical protein COB52_02410 [Candidatus Kaiserbacteria bacterium]|nr:MAG: hypothetical protein COB52_02410 [Candidatus Kaiserbacteria bacterium]
MTRIQNIDQYIKALGVVKNALGIIISVAVVAAFAMTYQKSEAGTSIFTTVSDVKTLSAEAPRKSVRPEARTPHLIKLSVESNS